MLRRFVLLATVLSVLFSGCSKPGLSIDYEKYTLENGLEVVLHQDRSDPIVAVAILLHVGSNREEPGKTGFAHLFEHILFEGSANVGPGQFDKNIQAAGGTLNGATWQDGTIYFEVVPNNALEMVLWMESDRMGYLLGTVTQEAFENQQDVVQNEKRQRVDNRPYGHTNFLIDKALYPEEHPYNWQVIGSFEDLKNASLEDVKNFYLKWYGPNNATIVIAGDFDDVETKGWVEKYFGDIQSSGEIMDPPVMHPELTETKRLFHEDNFAKSPELNMVFPSAEGGHKDAYALEILGDLLADGKKTPLYKVIVEEEKLAPTVSAYQDNGELTSKFRIRIRTCPGVPLPKVEAAIKTALAKFEEDGFTKGDLNRIKAKQETAFYNGISSILNKAFNLAEYNEYYGSPGYIEEDLNGYLSLTKADILHAYNTYIKDKPFVLTSFVPKGETALVDEKAAKGAVVEEVISEATSSVSGQKSERQYRVPTNPSSFDRSVNPEFGPDPLLNIPDVWHHELANGIPIAGIEHHELPLIRFNITLKGGQILDPMDKLGVANMVSDLMMEGTASKTPQELEEAIDALGSTIRVVVSREAMTVQASTLTSRFDETYALAEELLFEPRWDEKEFARMKDQNLESINRGKADPRTISGNVFSELIYGNEHALGNPIIGHAKTVEAITIDDLKTYYGNYFAHSVTSVSVVGDITPKTATAVFRSLEREWPSSGFEMPVMPPTPEVVFSKIYFVDIPGAKQSQIRIGNLAIPYTHPDAYPVAVMNYDLGGNFLSQLNTILREEKGFTYGAGSRFSGSNYPGLFTAVAAVRSNATVESLQIFKDEMERYSKSVSDETIIATQNALIKTNARRFETLGALMGMLNNIQQYNLQDDYVKGREDYVRQFTAEQHQALARKYINPGKMVYLVVGDAKTQLEPLKDIGMGDPILLDID